MTDKEKDYGRIKELYKLGYSVGEIANELDIPEFSVKMFLGCALITELPNSTTVVKRDRNTGKITITRYDNTDEEEE